MWGSIAAASSTAYKARTDLLASFTPEQRRAFLAAEERWRAANPRCNCKPQGGPSSALWFVLGLAAGG